MWIRLALLAIAFAALTNGKATQKLNCDEGWVEFEGNCYLLTTQDTDELNWHQATAECAKYGAHLASINSEEEKQFIEDTAAGLDNSEGFWLGLNKVGDRTGDVEWSDGSEVGYTNWADDEPSNPDLQLCAYSLAVPNDNCFNVRENRNMIYGLMYYPWDENRPNTFSFGYYWTYDYPKWCEDECAREKNCDAWTYFTPYYYGGGGSGGYQWQSYCVGRSNFEKVDIPDYDTWAGTKQECGAVGLWYTENCGLSNGYLCKKEVGSDTPIEVPPTSPSTGYCPEGWLDAGNKCYLVEISDNQAGRDWDSSLAYCRGLKVPGLRDPDLASFNSREENAVITTNIDMRSFGLWTGIHQFGDYGGWGWADNTDASWTNWGPDEPQGFENCAEVWIVPGPPGTWNNINCEDKRGLICQGWKDDTIGVPPATTPSSCADGYTPYTYGCYKLVTDADTWVRAEQMCAMEGGHLVSIHAEPENEFVWTIGSATDAFPMWNGFRKGGDDEFRWTDGWPSYFTRWAEGEPGQNPNACVAINSEGRWYDADCDVAMAFMCKQTDIGRPTTPALGDGVCPNLDWKEYGDNCYYFGTTYAYPDYEKYDWVTAIGKCKELAGPSFAAQASLADIQDYQENLFVRTTLEQIKADDAVWDLNDVWIGLSKKDFGEPYTWTNGAEVNLLNWAPGEPNDYDGSENCVEMWLSEWNWPGMWNDGDCASAKYYVCKVPRGEAPTTPTLPPIVPGNCPSDEWEEYAGDCYLFRPDDYESWDTAYGQCVQATADFPTRASLTSIGDAGENVWIQNKVLEITQLPVRRGQWLGLYKQAANDDWKWFDGSAVTYTNWASGEPSDTDGTELCVEMVTENNRLGQWNDELCAGLKGFVCKVPKDTSGQYVPREQKSEKPAVPVIEEQHPVIVAAQDNVSHQEPHRQAAADSDKGHDSSTQTAVFLSLFGGFVALAVGAIMAVTIRKRRQEKVATESSTGTAPEVY